MKQNSQNNHNWASRIREYDILQEQEVREERWKRIRERLDKSPAKNRHRWYWAAAAGIILFLVLRPLLIVDPNEPGPVRFENPPAMVKEMKKQHDASGNTAINITNAKIPVNARGSNRINRSKDSSGVVSVQKDQNLVPAENSTAVNDTLVIKEDIAHEETTLPTVHINDIITKEPLPKNTSVKSLSVKKMIRLFSTDMTIEQSSKNQQKIPEQRNTIPDNQN